MSKEILALPEEKKRDKILEDAGYTKCFDTHRGVYDGGRYYHWHGPTNSQTIWSIATETEMDMVVANAIGAIE